MTTGPESLETIQRWMLSVITHPEGAAAGVASPAAQQRIPISAAQLESVVTRSQACTSLERLNVYAHAYVARLRECLEGEFPAVRHAAGSEAFGGFVLGYLQQCPPSSYTLGDLGRRFPEYLGLSQPTWGHDLTLQHFADFLVDLARLERIYAEVFDGPGEEGGSRLSAEQLGQIPPDRWETICLIAAPSLRLQRFAFPVQDYASAVRRGETANIPAAAPTWLIIHRRDYIVRRRAVSAAQWQLLSALQLGTPLGEAVVECVSRSDIESEELSRELQTWFGNWAAEGYFLGVVQSEPLC